MKFYWKKVFEIGLDNGFYVKSDKREITRDKLPEGIQYPFEKDYGEDVEIIYHRKDWGWRTDIMNSFGWRDPNLFDDNSRYLIETPAQVLELIELTARWLDEERWLDEGNSIWDYQETARRHLIEDIMNLTLFYSFMQTNPDVYLEFYDSY